MAHRSSIRLCKGEYAHLRQNPCNGEAEGELINPSIPSSPALSSQMAYIQCQRGWPNGRKD